MKNMLESIYEQRLTLYSELSELAKEQRDILIEGRHDELESNLSAQSAAVSKLDALDNQERELGEETGGDGALQSSVRDAAQKLASLVEINRTLLGNAMNYVRFSMGVISNLATESASGTYNSSVVLDTLV